jgi:hypothetical protein
MGLLSLLSSLCGSCMSPARLPLAHSHTPVSAHRLHSSPLRRVPSSHAVSETHTSGVAGCRRKQVPAAGMIACFSFFDLPQFRGPRLAATALLLWVFPLAALPLTYLLQFGFTVGWGCVGFPSFFVCSWALHSVTGGRVGQGTPCNLVSDSCPSSAGREWQQPKCYS